MASLYKTIRKCLRGLDNYMINNSQISITNALPYKTKLRIDFYTKYNL